MDVLLTLLDVVLAVGFVAMLILWMDERWKRIDVESRLKKHRNSVLIRGATNAEELHERGG